MNFVDELKQAHEIEKKRLEEKRKKELEDISARAHEAIQGACMRNAAAYDRTHIEGFVALAGSPGYWLECYEKPPIVGRRDADGNFTWNDGGVCSVISTDGEYCDAVIAMVSDLLRKDGFVNFTLSQCPCYQKKWVRRKHFLSPDTTELIDTNNFLGYIIKYSVSW